jgi:hypothetical protein
VRRIPLLLLAISAPSAWAGLEWETTLREVRATPGEKSIAVTFPFRNPGPEAIGISSVQTSCGCTSAKPDLKEVPPGGKGALEVRFDVGKRTGEQVKGIIVRTSDKEKYKLVLRVLLPNA